ncbi:DUF1449 family protein [bacterium]|nr:MAG: DUF1449 family protein [bacterium]
MEILLAPQNLPFSLSLAFVVVMGALQLLLGLGDAIGHVAFDADLDLDGHISPFEAALDWLWVGKIPFSILLILFCLCFGLSGIGLQAFEHHRSGSFFPPLLAAALAFFITIPLLRLTGWALRPIMPRDETEAVSPNSLVGRDGQITLGVARRGHPAEARVRDGHGKTHYIMVEPETPGVELRAGDTVLLVSRRDHIFLALEYTQSNLQD